MGLGLIQGWPPKGCFDVRRFVAEDEAEEYKKKLQNPDDFTSEVIDEPALQMTERPRVSL